MEGTRTKFSLHNSSSSASLLLLLLWSAHCNIIADYIWAPHCSVDLLFLAVRLREFTALKWGTTQ